MASLGSNWAPLVETMTGSRTQVGLLWRSRARATASIVSAEASMPVQREGRDQTVADFDKRNDGEQWSMHKKRTDFHDIDANIINAGIDLFGDKRGGNMMNVVHTECVLGSQSCRRGHGIASMCCDDLLICF